MSPLGIIINICIGFEIFWESSVVFFQVSGWLHHILEDLSDFFTICSLSLASGGARVLNFKTHPRLQLRRPEHRMWNPRSEKQRLSIIISIIVVVVACLVICLSGSWRRLTSISWRIPIICRQKWRGNIELWCTINWLCNDNMSSVLTLLHYGMLIDGLHTLTLIIFNFLYFVKRLELFSQKLLRYLVAHSLGFFVDDLCISSWERPILDFGLSFRNYLLAGWHFLLYLLRNNFLQLKYLIMFEWFSGICILLESTFGFSEWLVVEIVSFLETEFKRLPQQGRMIKRLSCPLLSFLINYHYNSRLHVFLFSVFYEFFVSFVAS